MDRYRSGHNGPDSKFLEAPAVSSAENVRRTGLCAGSDFTISYRSCVFFLHSSGARITLEIYGELSERSKVRHSKDSIPKVRTSANFSDCTRDPPGSNFHKFISFLRVVLLFSKTGYTLRYTEGYRSGHNGADSKSVWVKAHVGSNPTPSARTQSYQGFQPI